MGIMGHTFLPHNYPLSTGIEVLAGVCSIPGQRRGPTS